MASRWYSGRWRTEDGIARRREQNRHYSRGPARTRSTANQNLRKLGVKA